MTQKENCWNNNLSPQYFHFGVPMSEVSPSASGPTLMSKILMAVGAIYVLASVVMMVVIFGKLEDMSKQQAATQASLEKKIAENNAQTRSSVEAVAHQVGMTKQELARNAARLQAKEKATESRLSADEQQTQQQLGAVNGEVSGVKNQAGKAQTDITTTRNDLALPKTNLKT